MDMLAAILAAIIGAGAALGVAILGLDAWRRELVGRRRIELAEETLTLFYEAVDAIGYMRNLSFWDDWPKLERKDGETSTQHFGREKAAAFMERLTPHSELFSRIRSLRYRFMAQIGKDKAAPFKTLQDVINEIRFSLKRLEHRPIAEPKPGTRESDDYNKVDAVLGWFRYHGMDDPIQPRLDALIEELESTCRSVISGNKSASRLFNFKLRLWSRR